MTYAVLGQRKWYKKEKNRANLHLHCFAFSRTLIYPFVFPPSTHTGVIHPVPCRRCREAKELAQGCAANRWQNQPRLPLPSKWCPSTCRETGSRKVASGGKSISPCPLPDHRQCSHRVPKTLAGQIIPSGFGELGGFLASKGWRGRE